MPWVLPSALKFPDLYTKFISCFAFFNFAILPRFLRLECEMRVDHYSQVFFMTLGPLLIFALGLGCFAIHRRSTPEPDVSASYAYWFLLGTYLIYPSVSTTLFQTLRCEVFVAPEDEEGEGKEESKTTAVASTSYAASK